MYHTALTLFFSLMFVLSSINSAFAAEKKVDKSPKAATRKEKKSKKKMGPARPKPLKEPKGGWENFGPMGIFAAKDGVAIAVQGTAPGSPADGALNKGDVIVKIEGEGIQSHKYVGLLARAVHEAEAGKNKGKVSLTLKDGKVVSLQLAQLGAYSPTAPYDCPKTEKIIAMAADALVKEIGLGKPKGGRIGSGPTQVELLGLMATGEKKYIDFVGQKLESAKTIDYDGKSLQAKARERIKLSGKGSSMVGCWSTGYAAIVMGEYYLLTKDEGILPALKTYTLSIVEGQDAAGLYGHKFAYPDTQRAPGYGQMNQVSLACYLAMLLAKKAGVDVPGLDKALARSRSYVEFHVNKGGFPYGFHGPREFDFNNNGTSGLAAVIMSIEGNKKGAQFFASMAAADPNLGQGHASSLFSTYWTPAGVNVGGPKLTQKVFPATVNYLTPRRLWDGSFVKGYGEGKIGGVALLAYCLPRKALLITGREADKSIWFDEKEAESIGHWKKLTADKTPEELLAVFNHENPVVRYNAVNAIKTGLGLDAKTLKKLRKPAQNHREKKKEKVLKDRIAAFTKHFVPLLPEIKEMLSSGTGHQKVCAIRCYLFASPESELKGRLKDIDAILRNTKESNDVRVAAAKQLAHAGKAAYPYFNDILSFLREERPSDQYAWTDVEISKGIGSILSSTRVVSTAEGDENANPDDAANAVSPTETSNPFKEGLADNKDLYYPAACRLMSNKLQNPRGVGVRMVYDIPNQDLPLVIDSINHILKDDDRGYYSYHSPQTAISPAAQIYGKHNIAEGLDYGLKVILDSPGKAGFKIRALMQFLPKYGNHAKRVIPRVLESKLIKVMYAQHAMNGSARFWDEFQAMLKKIESAKDGLKLTTVEEIRKRGETGKQ